MAVEAIGEADAHAVDLAKRMNLERDAFKRDVRKLEELGLTISLDPGYRLSPRGRALLRHLSGAEAAD